MGGCAPAEIASADGVFQAGRDVVGCRRASLIALDPGSRAPDGATCPGGRKPTLWIGSCSLRCSPTLVHGRRNVRGEVDTLERLQIFDRAAIIWQLIALSQGGPHLVSPAR